MPTPDQLEAVSRLGATALFALAIFALYTRRIRTSAEAAENKAEADARLAEMRTDRDAWKAIATSALAKMDRLTDVVETFTGKKVPD